MKKTEYRSGKEARERFERTMIALFRVPKNAVVPKRGPKAPKKSGKD